MNIDLVAGARPNIMKVAPLYHALTDAGGFKVRLVHTGQHYDYNLSQTFFDDFGLPSPDVFLDVRSGAHAVQTARVMKGYDKICLEAQAPDLVIVVGDVNSTLACALTAKKRNLAVAHLEAGLRSGDRSMPEEINRIVTDVISDHLWTHSPDADENLLREGQLPSRIKRVGNIMVDAYELMAGKIQRVDAPRRYGLPDKYIVATFHRPSNVDLPENLLRLIRQMLRCAEEMPVVFPVHPRTRQRLEAEGLWSDLAGTGILAIEPLGYVEFMSLVCSSSLVLTDSGGLQEETSYLGIRCVTVRPTTERPITITLGTNTLSPIDTVADVVRKRLSEPERPRPTIPLWDGHTSQRIVEALQKGLNSYSPDV
jgi:UDP-N-acetylglucosamine 2-epimerase (non-hydrolysing)